MDEFHEYLKHTWGFESEDEHRIKDFQPIGGNPKLILGAPSLLRLFQDKNFETGAEIGVFKGVLSLLLCEALKGPIYLIDPWKDFPKDIYPEDSLDKYPPNFDINDDNTLHQQRYKETSKKLSNYSNAVILREESVEALSDIENDSLDFVYLDGNHTPPFIWQDLRGWWRKLKSGGIMAGHDYCLVNRTVKIFAREKGIKRIYASSNMECFFIDIDGKLTPWQNEDWFFPK